MINIHIKNYNRKVNNNIPNSKQNKKKLIQNKKDLRKIKSIYNTQAFLKNLIALKCTRIFILIVLQKIVNKVMYLYTTKKVSKELSRKVYTDYKNLIVLKLKYPEDVKLQLLVFIQSKLPVKYQALPFSEVEAEAQFIKYIGVKYPNEKILKIEEALIVYIKRKYLYIRIRYISNFLINTFAHIKK